MFHNKFVKISEKLNKRNLLKICLQVTYPIIYILFYYGKKWNFNLKKKKTEKKNNKKKKKKKKQKKKKKTTTKNND